jgi:hypothetical protein
MAKLIPNASIKQFTTNTEVIGRTPRQCSSIRREHGPLTAENRGTLSERIYWFIRRLPPLRKGARPHYRDWPRFRISFLFS